MVILRSQNKIADFLLISAWASPFNNVEEQPILTRISDIGLTDDGLEDNICIKNYSVVGKVAN